MTERSLNTNKAAIESWTKGPPPASAGNVKSFYDTVPSGAASGRNPPFTVMASMPSKS
ncbi:hypothetical protein ACIOHB_34910 [Streptomyces microflavus]|uniref:hypothetical protein n=1 Tax=Streptomyces microflavus TaxID=1919 RepID=UPI00382D01E1